MAPWGSHLKQYLSKQYLSIRIRSANGPFHFYWELNPPLYIMYFVAWHPCSATMFIDRMVLVLHGMIIITFICCWISCSTNSWVVGDCDECDVTIVCAYLGTYYVCGWAASTLVIHCLKRCWSVSYRTLWNTRILCNFSQYFEPMFW